ncbi:hypothetical protein SCUP234_08906 [Seiridium cupressi]
MDLSGANGTDSATVGDYQSDNHSVGLWWTGNPENDIYHRGEVSRYVPEVTLTDTNLLPPEDCHLDDANGYCVHPWGARCCLSHYHHAGDIHSDSGVYPVPNSSPNTDSQQMLAPSGEQRRRSVSMPPAMERYVNDSQRHELLAVGHSVHDGKSCPVSGEKKQEEIEDLKPAGEITLSPLEQKVKD